MFLTSLLSVQSLLSPLPFDRLNEDGTVDWVKVCINNQLLYQESLSCYRRMRRKYYHYQYISSKSKESNWYREYVLNTSGNLFSVDNRKAIKFRLPFSSFTEVMVDIRRDKWFPNNEVCDCRGIMGVPVDLLVFGSLRYLGRGWTFDDLEEATGAIFTD